jgi:NADP-dependent 3-hydroxy acid dehydrogenase YdfG
MPADDVAALILHAYHMAPQTVVEELVIRPLEGDV